LLENSVKGGTRFPPFFVVRESVLCPPGHLERAEPVSHIQREVDLPLTASEVEAGMIALAIDQSVGGSVTAN
jgi:hypothetical protein